MVDISQLTVNVVMVVALLVATWRISAAATKVQESNQTLDKRMIAASAALEQVPLLIQRIGQIEEEQATIRRKIFSDFPRIQKDVAILQSKQESTDRFKAMRLKANGNGDE